MRGLAAFATLAALSLFGVTAEAQPNAREERPAAEAHLQLAAEAQEHYLAGRYERAAELLERAYALQPSPIFLLNLAKTFRRIGDASKELSAWRRYLDARPDAPDRQAIEERIQVLERTVAQAQARSSEAPASLATTAARPEERSSPMPWIVVGVGAASMVAGGVLGALAVARHDEAERARVGLEAMEHQDEAKTLAGLSTITLAAGGLLVAGGLGWWLLDRREASAPASGAVSVRPGIGGLSFVGRF